VRREQRRHEQLLDRHVDRPGDDVVADVDGERGDGPDAARLPAPPHGERHPAQGEREGGERPGEPLGMGQLVRRRRAQVPCLLPLPSDLEQLGRGELLLRHAELVLPQKVPLDRDGEGGLVEEDERVLVVALGRAAVDLAVLEDHAEVRSAARRGDGAFTGEHEHRGPARVAPRLRGEVPLVGEQHALELAGLGVDPLNVERDVVERVVERVRLHVPGHVALDELVHVELQVGEPPRLRSVAQGHPEPRHREREDDRREQETPRRETGRGERHGLPVLGPAADPEHHREEEGDGHRHDQEVGREEAADARQVEHAYAGAHHHVDAAQQLHREEQHEEKRERGDEGGEDLGGEVAIDAKRGHGCLLGHGPPTPSPSAAFPDRGPPLASSGVIVR